MKSSPPILKIVVICVCVIAANLCLQWMVDSDLGFGWTHISIRNWQQFGFTALKGQLITNPGGHDVLAHSAIYAGHRAASLYLPFLIAQAFSWTGSNELPFHAVLSVVIMLTIWRLLGATELALFTGGLSLLCPGYIIHPTVLGPETIPMLLGIPYAAFLWWCFEKPRFTTIDFVLLLLLTVLFSALNWTTALVHAQIFIALLVMRRIPLQRLALYLVCGSGLGGRFHQRFVQSFTRFTGLRRFP